MTTNPPPILLRVDSSARTEGSHSRHLADLAQARWQAAYPHGRVLRRDLAVQPVAHIEAATIQGFYTPAEQMTPSLRAALAKSDELIAELKAAHTLLISAPIYNFSVPSALKAWIDQVVRINQTFSYDGKGFDGLVKGPRAVLALAYGAAGYGDAMAGFDHLKPYLTSLLNFLGVTDVQTVSVEATTADADTVEKSRAGAERQVNALFAPALASQ
jgi:FMN-dependent NADH-azoreductase